MKSLVLSVLTLLSSVALAAPQPVQDLQTFVRAYNTGNVAAMAPLLHPDIDHDGTAGAEQVLLDYQALFKKSQARELSLHHVRYTENGAVMWFSLQGHDLNECIGVMEVEYTGDTWSRWDYLCLDVGQPGEGFDYGVEVASAVDSTATHVLLQAGGQELNPIMAPVADAAGGFGLMAVKLGLSEAFEYADLTACVGGKSGIALGGWIGVGFTIGGPVGLAVGAGINELLDSVFDAEAGYAEDCMDEFGPVVVDRIAWDTGYEPAPAKSEPVLQVAVSSHAFEVFE